jgi:acyl-CoA thioesterase-1
MPTPAPLPSPNLAWGCSIRRLSWVVAALLAVSLVATGCSAVSQANANIAFMGDSITAFWWLPKTNLGVAGDTTARMIARFPGQVLGKDYKAVVILAGTNDIRNKALPIQEQVDTAILNIGEMAAMAEKDHLTVVLCKIPPIRNVIGRVEPLNEAIESYALAHQYRLVDYYTPMLGHPEYFRDGIHPSDQGYFVMKTALTGVLPLDY